MTNKRTQIGESHWIQVHTSKSGNWPTPAGCESKVCSLPNSTSQTASVLVIKWDISQYVIYFQLLNIFSLSFFLSGFQDIVSKHIKQHIIVHLLSGSHGCFLSTTASDGMASTSKGSWFTNSTSTLMLFPFSRNDSLADEHKPRSRGAAE